VGDENVYEGRWLNREMILRISRFACVGTTTFNECGWKM